MRERSERKGERLLRRHIQEKNRKKKKPQIQEEDEMEPSFPYLMDPTPKKAPQSDSTALLLLLSCKTNTQAQMMYQWHSSISNSHRVFL